MLQQPRTVSHRRCLTHQVPSRQRAAGAAVVLAIGIEVMYCAWKQQQLLFPLTQADRGAMRETTTPLPMLDDLATAAAQSSLGERANAVPIFEAVAAVDLVTRTAMPLETTETTFGVSLW